MGSRFADRSGVMWRPALAALAATGVGVGTAACAAGPAAGPAAAGGLRSRRWLGVYELLCEDAPAAYRGYGALHTGDQFHRVCVCACENKYRSARGQRKIMRCPRKPPLRRRRRPHLRRTRPCRFPGSYGRTVAWTWLQFPGCLNLVKSRKTC